MRHFAKQFVFMLSLSLLALPALAQDIISTAIGGGPNNIPALDANLNQPDAVAVDSTGNYYISAYGQNRIFKVDTSGILTVFAGQGIAGYAGDGVKGGATQAFLNGPQGIAVDPTGNIYFSDYNNCAVRKIDTTNTITTIAGIGGHCGYGGDGGKGTAANLYLPVGVAVDSTGANVYIADRSNCRVRKVVVKTDIISTYAGNGTCGYSGDNGSALSAELNQPNGVWLDGSNNLVIADTSNYRIREVTKSNGKINTIGGNGTNGFSGDGGSALSAEISVVIEITVSSDGQTITFPDQNNQRVRQFKLGGNINTVAGNGTACNGTCGDGGAATSAELYYPQGIAATAATQTFLIADLDNNRVRQFKVGGNINGAAGNGSTTVPTLLNGIAPGGVVPNSPFGVVGDPSNNVYFGDTGNQMVRELVNSTDLVDFFAGDGVAGYSGDGGLATKAQLYNPRTVAIDSKGNVYIADESNQVIRQVDTGGKIHTFAGTPQTCGFTGDGGPATSARLCNPYGVSVDSQDNVYIADYSNCVVRKVTNGTINTIAGTPGRCIYGGDGGPATSAFVANVQGTAEDAAGNVFIADTNNCRIREISATTGIITTVAGTGQCGFNGDGPATSVAVSSPSGVWVDASGNLFIADTYNQRIRWVDTTGNMTTIAGNGSCGYTGDGIPALTAEFCYPTGVYTDASGNFLVADQNNFRIRGITAFPEANLSTDSLVFGLQAVGTSSSPQIVTLTALGPLTVSSILTTGDFSETDNCPASLPNGQACSIYVYFSPTAAGQRLGTLTINDNGYFNTAPVIQLSGLGTAISITGSPANFGNQLVKTNSQPKTVTVTNNGTSGITMGSITLNETTDFSISSNNCPAKGKTLAAGASCSIGLTFSPQTTGAKKGTLSINDNDPTSPQLVALSGTGTSNVQLTPAAIAFPNTPVKVTSATSTVTLTNNTGSTLTLGNPAVQITAGFVIVTTKTTCTNGLKVANNGTCVVGVAFKPTAVGYATGTLSVNDNDPTSPQTVALSGTGVPIQFTPASVNFGSVTVGHQVSSQPSITNVGTVPVTFNGSDIVGTNSADFLSNFGNCPVTLAPGASCTINVYFTPSKKGKESATFESFDTGLGSPHKLPMTGTGQ